MVESSGRTRPLQSTSRTEPGAQRRPTGCPACIDHFVRLNRRDEAGSLIRRREQLVRIEAEMRPTDRPPNREDAIATGGQQTRDRTVRADVVFEDDVPDAAVAERAARSGQNAQFRASNVELHD